MVPRPLMTVPGVGGSSSSSSSTTTVAAAHSTPQVAAGHSCSTLHLYLGDHDLVGGPGTLIYRWPGLWSSHGRDAASRLKMS